MLACASDKILSGKILDSTLGLCVNQVSFRQHTEKFVADKNMDLNFDQIETGIYALRTLMSQMANQKNKDRRIPDPWQRHYSIIFDKIACVDNAHDDSEVEEIPIIPRAIPIIDVESDDEIDAKELFRSEHPKLQQLLQVKVEKVDSVQDGRQVPMEEESNLAGSEPVGAAGMLAIEDLITLAADSEPSGTAGKLAMEEINNLAADSEPGGTAGKLAMKEINKVADTEPNGTAGKLSMEEMNNLAGSGPQGVVGKDKWAALQAEKKKEHLDRLNGKGKGKGAKGKGELKKGKDKGKKGKKGKGNGKGGKGGKVEGEIGGKIDYNTWRKREHSKVYHTERTKLLRAGRTAEFAKKNSGLKATAHMQNIDKQRAAGTWKWPSHVRVEFDP